MEGFEQTCLLHQNSSIYTKKELSAKFLYVVNSVCDADGIVAHGLAHPKEGGHQHGARVAHVRPARGVYSPGGHHHAEPRSQVGFGRGGTAVCGAVLALPGGRGGAPGVVAHSVLQRLRLLGQLCAGRHGVVETLLQRKPNILEVLGQEDVLLDGLSGNSKLHQRQPRGAAGISGSCPVTCCR